MSKKLAIKGHSTRGNEVIELLEMMGGVNVDSHKGNFPEEWKSSYYIYGDNTIQFARDEFLLKLNFRIFTLEEFLEKYPFKIGDRVLIPEYESEVRICGMSWDGFEIQYKVYRNEDPEWYTAKELLNYNDDFFEDKHCNKNQVNGMKNVLAELLDHIKNTSKEELEKEFNEFEEWSHVGPTVEEFMDFCDKVNKKPKYPKTYEECCEVLVGRKPNPNEISFNKLTLCLVDLDNTQNIDFQNPQLFQFNGLFRLLMCRNAYWKIAGEELGLDKPWEPDWNDEIQKYCIRTDRNKIVNCSSSFNNRILAFPTEEMRDAFYENFKDLIEQCKELL